MKDIHSVLKDARIEANLTQQRIAIHVGCDPATISRFERGLYKKPDPQLVLAIIGAYKDSRSLSSARIKELEGLVLEAGDTNFILSPAMVRMLRIMNSMTPEQREAVIHDHRLVTIFNQRFIAAKEKARQRDWASSIEMFLGLQNYLLESMAHFHFKIESELAHARYCEGQLSEAIETYHKALSSAQTLKEPWRIAQILRKMGNAHRRFGSADGCESSLAYYERAEQAYLIADRSEISDARYLRKKAGAYLLQGRPYKAENYIEKSKEKSGGDLESSYKILQHRAWFCSMVGKWRQAIELSKEAIDLIPEENTWELVKAFRYLGDSYRMIKDFKNAIKEYKVALEYYDKEQTGEGSTYAMIQLGLAKAYMKLGEYSEADSFLEEGQKIHAHRPEDVRSVEFYVEHGQLQMMRGYYREADKDFSRARRDYKKRSNYFHYVRTLASIANLYFQWDEKSSEELIILLREALDVEERSQSGSLNYFIAQMEYLVGKERVKHKAFESAEAHWLKALRRTIEFNQKSYDEMKALIEMEVNKENHFIEFSDLRAILNGK